MKKRKKTPLLYHNLRLRSFSVYVCDARVPILQTDNCLATNIHVRVGIKIDVLKQSWVIRIYTYTTFWKSIQVQVANTQWILFVELHQFHNLYNAEVRSNEFCCCDDSCNSQASKPQECDAKCDTWFTANVSHCIQPYWCSFNSSTIWATASIINLNYKFYFLLNSFPDMVSAKR